MAKSGESWINYSISSLFSETNAMCQRQHDNLQFEGNLDKGLTLDTMHAQIPNSSDRKRPIGSSLNDIHLLDSPLDNTNLEGRNVSNAEERSTVCDMPSERIRDRMLETDSQTTPRTDAHTQSTVCVRDKGMRENDKHKRKSWHSDEDHQKEFQVLRKSKKIQSTSDSAVSTKGNLLDVLTESCRSRSTIESIELVYNNDLDSSDTEEQSKPTVEIFSTIYGAKPGLGIKLFITFSLNPLSKNQVICCEMKALVMGLIEVGISVKMDRCAEAIEDIIGNQHDWIDEQIGNADKILVCITPQYHRDIHPPNANDAEAFPIQLNARYVHDILRSEYKNNQCRNKRVIPIIFTNTGGSMEHVPPYLRSTIQFFYPRDHFRIICVLLGRPTDITLL